MQNWVDCITLLENMVEIEANKGEYPEHWDIPKGTEKPYRIPHKADVSPDGVGMAYQHLKAMRLARVYEIDGRMQRTLCLTPNRPRHIELPFSHVFLNPSIEFNDTMVLGILLIKDGREDKGDGDILITVVLQKALDKPKDIKLSEWLRKTRNSYSNMVEIDSWAIWLNKKNPEHDNELDKYVGGNLCSMLRRATMNFNDFLEHPEIVLKFRDRTKQNEKRERRGKNPYPDSTLIKVTGQLKIYLDSMKNNGNGDNMGGC